MRWLEIIIFVIVLINIIMDIYVGIYVRAAVIRDERKSQLRNSVNESCIALKENKSKSMKYFYKVYKVFEQFSYGLMRYRIILVGRIPSYKIRNFLYRYIYKMNITTRTKIAGGCEFRSPWNLKADNCIIGLGCILDARQGIIIGDNVVLGGRSTHMDRRTFGK